MKSDKNKIKKLNNLLYFMCLVSKSHSMVHTMVDGKNVTITQTASESYFTKEGLINLSKFIMYHHPEIKGQINNLGATQNTNTYNAHQDINQDPNGLQARLSKQTQEKVNKYVSLNMSAQTNLTKENQELIILYLGSVLRDKYKKNTSWFRFGVALFSCVFYYLLSNFFCGQNVLTYLWTNTKVKSIIMIFFDQKMNTLKDENFMKKIDNLKTKISYTEHNNKQQIKENEIIEAFKTYILINNVSKENEKTFNSAIVKKFLKNETIDASENEELKKMITFFSSEENMVICAFQYGLIAYSMLFWITNFISFIFRGDVEFTDPWSFGNMLRNNIICLISLAINLIFLIKFNILNIKTFIFLCGLQLSMIINTTLYYYVFYKNVIIPKLNSFLQESKKLGIKYSTRLGVNTAPDEEAAFSFQEAFLQV
jgi:hypothetical protein